MSVSSGKHGWTKDCNGPRDCVGTEAGCWHCNPEGALSALEAAEGERNSWESRARTALANFEAAEADARQYRLALKAIVAIPEMRTSIHAGEYAVGVREARKIARAALARSGARETA